MGAAREEGVVEIVLRSLRRDRRVGGWREGEVSTARVPERWEGVDRWVTSMVEREESRRRAGRSPGRSTVSLRAWDSSEASDPFSVCRVDRSPDHSCAVKAVGRRKRRRGDDVRRC